MCDISRAQIYQRQHERRQCESGQSQWRRVGEFAELGFGRLVETWLEITTKGCQASIGFVGSVMSQWVSAVVIWPSLLCYIAVVSSMVASANAIGLLVMEEGLIVESMRILCGSGHFEGVES